MRITKSNTVRWASLLLALLSGAGAHAGEIGTKSPKVQPTQLPRVQPTQAQAAAETQAAARRQGMVNVNGIGWNCSGTRCSAPTSPAAGNAPVVLCQGLAREVGALQGFSIANRALSGDELRHCNSVVPTATTLPGLNTSQGFTPMPQSPVPGAAATPSPIQPPPFPSLGAGPAAPAKSPASKSAGAPSAGILMPPTTPNPKFVAPSPTHPKPGKGFVPDTATTPTSSIVVIPPRRITTDALVMTGIRFTPTAITTAGLSMTGTRFQAVSIRTGDLAMTGIRFRSVDIRTGSLEMTGTRASTGLALSRGGAALPLGRVVIGTNTLTMTGQRFHPVTIGTSSLTFTGNR
jgi:hypothetical protein